MHYKYINVNLVGGETITVRDGEMTDQGDFIKFEAERVIWHVPLDQIRYVKISKQDDTQ